MEIADEQEVVVALLGSLCTVLVARRDLTALEHDQEGVAGGDGRAGGTGGIGQQRWAMISVPAWARWSSCCCWCCMYSQSRGSPSSVVGIPAVLPMVG